MSDTMQVRAGIVCRAEDRGLGTMTKDAYDALDWDRSAVITYEVRDDRFPLHLDRFPEATLLHCDMHNGRQLDEDECRDWLRGLDVVYLAETAYDWRFLDWARDEGVVTVIHGMPEYTPHTGSADHGLPSPDAWWWPTPWRREYLPAGPVVPVPIPDGVEFTAADPTDDGPLVVHHVVGHRSRLDRNGTSEVLRAVQSMSRGVRLRMFTQDGNLHPARPAPGVEYEVVTDTVEDRFDLFAGAHLLLMPRRYGGLCLPVQEALGCGVATLMPDLAPNAEYWPTLTFDVPDRIIPVRMLGGTVAMADVQFKTIARRINELAADRTEVARGQAAARAWAERSTWSALAPSYRGWLAEAVELHGRRRAMVGVPEVPDASGFPRRDEALGTGTVNPAPTADEAFDDDRIMTQLGTPAKLPAKKRAPRPRRS